MKIYFAGSIRGGRELAEGYAKIINSLKKNHSVLSEHIGYSDVANFESKRTDEDIFKRDSSWVRECDVVVAEVTIPSIGVGWEISYAQSLGKKVICLFNTSSDKKISAIISGNKALELIKYSDFDTVIAKLNSLLD